jgi:ABC-type transport system involved in cytochrome bd biosynthesis fused ATPase/permease subunit
MGDLKAYGREDEAVANIDEVGRAYTASTMATLRVAFLSGFALELLSSLAVALVALVLGLRLIAGHLDLTVAMTVLLVVPEVFVPLRRSASQYHASVAGMAAGEALLGLLSDDTPSGTLRAPLSPPSISFENVVVAADVRGRPTVPFSTSVAPGETLLLEGPSGAGKTTVLRTLLGRVPLREGHIRINGIDLADIDMSAWRRAIAYVPQEPRLVGDTVREALTYGADATSDDDLSRVLRAVGLTVSLEHPLGEGSYTLSAGQRRRVALARALVSKPVVILLDEPLGHLDDDTAAEIREVLAHLPATVVVTSHRPLESAVTAQVRGAHR